MSRKRRKPLPLLEQISISSIGAKGKAVAWMNDIPIYVDQGVPGDVVDLQITRRKNKQLEARVVHVHQYSNQRIDPFCQHFGECGGCKWQYLPYDEQLNYKQKAVWTALESLHLTEPFEFREILPSPSSRYYRNKLEFTFSNRRWLSQAEVDSSHDIAQRQGLGFHIRGRFDKVLDIEECYLQPEPSNVIRQSLRSFALENQLEFYDPKEHTGFLRTLMIRTTSTQESMVVVVFARDDRDSIHQVMQHLASEFPQITSLMYTINTKLNDTIYDLDIIPWRGDPFITEQLGDLQFRIGAKSFFQTNTEQAFQLYKQVEKFAGLSGHETVYDLYTGTGTIANFVAHHAAQVIGIEYVAEAIEDAKKNSQLNNIHNTRFFAGDMKEVLNQEFIDREGRPDVLITDPPRAGMHPDVIKTILAIQPSRIVYVSCNPTTQATDIGLLQEQYTLRCVQPVDMFPQTYHVETVALLERRHDGQD